MILLSFFEKKSKDLKLFWIEFPKTLLIITLVSNLVTDVSLIFKVDWQAVSRLINSAFFEIWLPNPEFVIILTPSKKYSKDRGPDWYDFENFFLGGLSVSMIKKWLLYFIFFTIRFKII